MRPHCGEKKTPTSLYVLQHKNNLGLFHWCPPLPLLTPSHIRKRRETNIRDQRLDVYCLNKKKNLGETSVFQSSLALCMIWKDSLLLIVLQSSSRQQQSDILQCLFLSSSRPLRVCPRVWLSVCISRFIPCVVCIFRSQSISQSAYASVCLSVYLSKLFTIWFNL